MRQGRGDSSKPPLLMLFLASQTTCLDPIQLLGLGSGLGWVLPTLAQATPRVVRHKYGLNLVPDFSGHGGTAVESLTATDSDEEVNKTHEITST
ncbi:hypothetical protein Sjap_007127 [Stephania japonica]|uniref:Uncharacterized protein n=1 Tax=Stephania japonica TaxID=461633 RepID=A0AAP0JNP3_9MAGN